MTAPQSPNLSEHKPHQFGARLQSAREAIGMDRKDAATQLHLHEKVIIMIESGLFETELPITFIRGYIRNYSKLLEIPEEEVKDALNLIKPKLTEEEQEIAALKQTLPKPHSKSHTDQPVTSNNFFMQLFTSLIVVTMIGLVAVWWHSHKTSENVISENVSLEQAAPMRADTIVTAVDVGLAAATSPKIAENKTDLPPGEDLDNATVQSNTTSPVKNPPTSHPSHVASSLPDTHPTVKSSPSMYAEFLNRGDKQAAHQIIDGDHYMKSLLNFILFLIIINFSLRRYYNHPLSYTTTESRRIQYRARMTNTRDRFSRGTQTAPKFNLKTISFFAIIIIGSLIGYASILWYQHNHSISDLKKETKTKQNISVIAAKDPANNLQIDADIETLAPSSNLNAKLMTNFKINALQVMVNQLNDYVTQAAASYFTLTDQSTDLGAFKYKKKYRQRHRQVIQTYNDDNADPYNDNEQTSYAPPNKI